jgi:hypothetical protein
MPVLHEFACRTIARSVVDDENVETRVVTCLKGLEATCEIVGAVPRAHGDSERRQPVSGGRDARTQKVGGAGGTSERAIDERVGQDTKEEGIVMCRQRTVGEQTAGEAVRRGWMLEITNRATSNSDDSQDAVIPGETIDVGKRAPNVEVQVEDAYRRRRQAHRGFVGDARRVLRVRRAIRTHVVDVLVHNVRRVTLPGQAALVEPDGLITELADHG